MDNNEMRRDRCEEGSQCYRDASTNAYRTMHSVDREDRRDSVRQENPTI